MPKKTTEQMIEDLAIAVGKGFEEMGRQFSELREQVRGVEDRLDRIDAKVTDLSGRIEIREDQMRLDRTKLSL